MDFIHPADVSAVSNEFTRSFEKDHVRTPVRHRIRKTDDTYMQVESVITSLLNVPEIQGAMITTRDISGWVQAEHVLQTSIARYHRAEQLARSGYWEHKEGAPTVILSEGAKALFGLPACECSLSDFEGLLLPEHREQFSRAKHALISEGLRFDMVYSIRRKDNGAVVTAHSVAEYDPEEKVMFCAVHEINRVV